jgi:regulator of protease activity HflC (stomatin/prohibitin superfamily)
VAEAVLLRKVGLPPVVANAIQEKLKREQEAEQMKFVLQKEQQEAERKRIEAQGIADFQRIVASGISSQLLEWKGIEATEKLALSANSKIVVIGNPKSGLPIILGGAEK